MKDSNKRADIAHEVVCNAIASLNEQLKQENMVLPNDRLQILEFDLEKQIRMALKSAKYDANKMEF